MLSGNVECCRDNLYSFHQTNNFSGKQSHARMLAFVKLTLITLFILTGILCSFGNQDIEGLESLNDYQHSTVTPLPSSKASKGGECFRGDLICEKDKLGYEAIKSLHAQMDDDHNGDIDLEESAEYLREELEYSKTSSTDSVSRSKKFHANDTHISVNDLWNIWKRSTVHNWTVDQTADWLITHVELPQYAETFKMNAVDGSTLPRLAVNSLNYVSNILGIKSLVHKQKLALKATDVVLFGPPKVRYMKDIALLSLLSLFCVATGSCWWYIKRNKQLEIDLKRTLQDMESLSHKSQALEDLQHKLEEQEDERKTLTRASEVKESEISTARAEAAQLKESHEIKARELIQLREASTELEMIRQQLLTAKKELAARTTGSPVEMQKWLQLTYELEWKGNTEKKLLAEHQYANAKEMIERLNKKRLAFFGALRVAHSGTIDQVDKHILAARKALEEVHHDLSECRYRWSQIENLCGFSIISNPGIRSLINSTGHTDLYRYGKLLSLGEQLSETNDDVLEDIPPTYTAVLNGSPSQGSSITSNSCPGSLVSQTSDESRESSEPPNSAPVIHTSNDMGLSGLPAVKRLPSENVSKPSGEDSHTPMPYDGVNRTCSSIDKDSTLTGSPSSNKPSTGSLVGTPTSIKSCPERPTFNLNDEETSSSTSSIPSHIAINSNKLLHRPRLERDDHIEQQSSDTEYEFRHRSHTESNLEHKHSPSLRRSETESAQLKDINNPNLLKTVTSQRVLTDSTDSLQSTSSLGKKKSKFASKLFSKLKQKSK